MKKRFISHRVLFGILLILLSAAFYAVHYLIFRDSHHIFIYFLGDLGFLFIEVLLVTMVIHELLSEREKRSMLKKLNMVIGAFFSEVGTELLGLINDFDNNTDKISNHLKVGTEWTTAHFDKIRKILDKREHKIDSMAADMGRLKDLMLSKRQFLLRLLENPNLLEHESFTELLWAVFHLEEELSHRKKVAGLPKSDYEHLSGDIKRAYGLLIREWLSYMQHLKSNYPYLFSLAIRTNPFDPEATIEIQS